MDGLRNMQRYSRHGVRPGWAAAVAAKERGIEVLQVRPGPARKMKRPLILNRVNGLGIWLRGQDLNL
jgi:hypothetical protein